MSCIFFAVYYSEAKKWTCCYTESLSQKYRLHYYTITIGPTSILTQNLIPKNVLNFALKNSQ